MRATIRRAVEAHKAQREENGQAGFSLIELIIVVVILGVLAAIAIPIFLNIQDQARQNAADAIAGNGATQAAAQIAQNEAADVSNLAVANTDPTKATIVLLVDSGTATAAGTVPTVIEDVCVYVSHDTKTSWAGPGC